MSAEGISPALSAYGQIDNPVVPFFGIRRHGHEKQRFDDVAHSAPLRHDEQSGIPSPGFTATHTMMGHCAAVVRDYNSILARCKFQQRRIGHSAQTRRLHVENVDGWFAQSQAVNNVGVQISSSARNRTVTRA